MKQSKHGRFYLALGIGLAGAGFSFGWSMPPAVRALVGADLFFTVYLALLITATERLTPDQLRRHAADTDEGLPLILILALASVGISIGAIFLVLNVSGGPSAAEAALALTAVPLGWGMIHALLSLNYAHVFYAKGSSGRDAGGLSFPGTETPGVWDFFYFSFGIGMTAQVADVSISDPRLRQRVLLHSIGSFFYNTVILALAVNAAVALGS
jgi:uncharacterized membrane protein